MPGPRIAFIGAGNITRSLVKGLSKKYSPQNFFVSNRSPEKLEQLVRDYGVTPVLNNPKAVESADAVILAVKPPFMQQVCSEISPMLRRNKPVVVSLSAATKTDDIFSWCSVQFLGIVRTMTNTPTAVGRGTTALYANIYVDSNQKELVKNLFDTVGTAFWIQREEYFQQFASLIGCGPAFVFLLAEAMQKAAQDIGIPSQQADKIVLDVIRGSIELALKSDERMEILRKKVTTPKGITESALKALGEEKFIGLFREAFHAGKNRCAAIESEASMIARL